MGIRLLPEEVASRIAAGEVVERPASVIKELVENSLDAGATRIEIETREGGKSLLRIRDNGSGIPAAEVLLAFRRHATSKLETADDLERIATLGFRGEALASIASVSRLTCTTRHLTETTGTRVRIEGGTIVSQTPIGRPAGTEMLIEDLFYNVPARRKFLHSDRTERRHADAFLTRYAIAYPQVGFYVVHDGTEALVTPGNGSAREVLLNVYGLDLGSSLLEISPSFTADHPIRITGFAGSPSVHRADRGYITLFINGRWIQDIRLGYAIQQAYHTLLPVNRYPVAYVVIEMPAEDVDVNVHPAKSEVRFRDSDAVFRAVQRAVRATIMEEAPTAAVWQPTSEPASMPFTPSPEPEARPLPEPAVAGTGLNQLRARLSALEEQHPVHQLPLAAPPDQQREISPETWTHPQPPSEPLSQPSTAPNRPTLPPLRVVGQLATMYIIAEGPDGLYLIDQHAAHERVLYEQLIGGWMSGATASQPLLEPETVVLPLDIASRLEEILPTLQNLGLEIEPFGPGAFQVRAMPAAMHKTAAADLLADLATSDGERSPLRETLEERIIRRICKRIAVKAGQILTTGEMENLLRALEKTVNPRTCPHGRPTLLQISVEQLARQFGRL